MKILHLSDVHLRADTASEIKILFNGIVKLYSSLEKPLIVTTGDIVDQGNDREYEQIKEALEILKRNQFEWIACPGNHDFGRGNELEDKLPQFSSNIYNNVTSQDPFIKEGVYFLGLNSMTPNDDETLGKIRLQGRLGEDQLNSLSSKINQIRSNDHQAKIVVYMHHHPFPGWSLIKRFGSLKDRRAFLDVIDNKINVLLFGHKHVGKRFKRKEKKHGLDVILGCKKTTEEELSEINDKSDEIVFQFNEIDLDTFNVKSKEISYNG